MLHYVPVVHKLFIAKFYFYCFKYVLMYITFYLKLFQYNDKTQKIYPCMSEALT